MKSITETKKQSHSIQIANDYRIDWILWLHIKLNKKLKKIMTDLTKLEEAVAKNTEVDESAIVLLKGLKEKLDQAGTDPIKLKELSDSLGASTERLAAAVVANTPGETP